MSQTSTTFTYRKVLDVITNNRFQKLGYGLPAGVAFGIAESENKKYEEPSFVVEYGTIVFGSPPVILISVTGAHGKFKLVHSISLSHKMPDLDLAAPSLWTNRKSSTELLSKKGTVAKRLRNHLKKSAPHV